MSNDRMSGENIAADKPIREVAKIVIDQFEDVRVLPGDDVQLDMRMMLGILDIARMKVAMGFLNEVGRQKQQAAATGIVSADNIPPHVLDAMLKRGPR